MGKWHEAERFLALREQDFPDSLFEARDIFENFIRDPKRKGLSYTRLSEVYFWLGEYAEDADDQEEFYGEGVEAGRSAVQWNAQDAASHLWFGANMGAHGVVRGIMASLSYLGPIEKHALRAIELDETYFFGAPLRLAGRFYHKAPGFPLGPGNVPKAISLLEKAVRTGPEFILNHFYLADALYAARKKGEAALILEEILARPEPRELPDYHGLVQDQAQTLLSKIKN